ncbi:MAG: transketolase [Oscillospiraceae bacterium]|jgi:transketolase|nr:transketolase [Oscillospiraceae bacterium]
MNTEQLTAFAREIRVTTLRELAVPGFGHIGGAMSIVETLAVLYGKHMRYDAGNPHWQDRDKLVLSKGHSGPSLYAALSLKGFFPADMLTELNKAGGRLPSHVDRTKTPGVDMTAGSLGQGLSVACGIALGDRMDGRDSRTFCIVGDGELNEGQNWEAVMFAAQFKLKNLTLLVDNNKVQLDGWTNDVMSIGNATGALESFGWHVLECNGHDVGAIDAAITKAKSDSRPSAIILDTVKGKGANFAEAAAPGNHHMTFTAEQIELAIREVLK